MRFVQEDIRKAMCLYAVTDSSWLGQRTLEEAVRDAIKGGATFIQYREKEANADEFTRQAEKIKAVTDEYKVPFVINDEVEIAAELDVDGVHIGQSDVSLLQARKILGENKIIGVSVQTVLQAVEAEKNGADYLGVGAVFTTSTKKDADSVSLATLKAIRESVSIPVAAIGGISEKNVLQLEGTNIDGIAVVSGIFAAPDISRAAQKLRKMAGQLVKDN